MFSLFFFSSKIVPYVR